MPNFDFDAADRTHINSVKWDVAPGGTAHVGRRYGFCDRPRCY